MYKQSLVLLKAFHSLEHVAQEADKRRHCRKELRCPAHELVLLHMVFYPILLGEGEMAGMLVEHCAGDVRLQHRMRR